MAECREGGGFSYMEIEFLLNGETVSVAKKSATCTLLDWLREDNGLCGTKEGCNEGDCGACTVMVSSLDGEKVTHQAQNACILFLPQLQGKSVTTVEGLTGPGGELHPVQAEMVKHHGSQCGFCTPGIVMSLAIAHRNGNKRHDDVLAGNLCRCTGYAPIIRAANAAARKSVPKWQNDHIEKLSAMATATDLNIADAFVPATIESLALWYEKNPDATIVGGATDVGLWVTKQLLDLKKPVFVSQIKEMQRIRVTDHAIRIGAAASLGAVQTLMADHFPDFAELIRRFASPPVRNAATIGGNIANGSPIGDAPPALIALAATLHLRKGNNTREIAIEDFFVDYGKQDRAAGEFVEAISIPRQPDHLKCYKISKRFDQDITAVLGCFNIVVDDDNHVKSARIAFGGMAATPKKAKKVEAALLGQIWNDASIKHAMTAFDQDFAPIDDMRASAVYRLQASRNLLLRYFAEGQLGPKYTRVLAVKS